MFTGKIVAVRVDEVLLPDGRSASREVVEHPGAAVILPLTDAGEVLMVRQYRHAVGATLLELPAGTLDRGERPLQCARRELLEEVGAEAASWEPLGVLYPAPGILTEVMHLFVARRLREGRPLGTAEEDLDVERVPMDQAVALIRQGEIRDAKSVAGLLLARLRQAE